MVNGERVGVGPGGYGTFWSGLFVQNKQALTAVRWQDRQTYHAHLISNHTLLMVLDTGMGSVLLLPPPPPPLLRQSLAPITPQT